MVKYLICHGWVTSEYDGDRHYITPSQLISLYNVKPSECKVMPKYNKGYTLNDDLIKLSPDSSGEYIIPQKKNIT